MKIDLAQGMVQTLYADVPEDGTLPAAKALHQMGANNKRPNTFIEYVEKSFAFLYEVYTEGSVGADECEHFGNDL